MKYVNRCGLGIRRSYRLRLKTVTMMPLLACHRLVSAWCSQYEGCTSCKTKVGSQDGIVHSECCNCGMMMKFSTCPKYCSSKICVVETNRSQRDLTIFKDILVTIVEDCEPKTNQPSRLNCYYCQEITLLRSYNKHCFVHFKVIP